MTAFQPLHLPNGTVIPNRIAKAAMEENLADASQGPSAELLRLYQAWAEGGAGLLITGNVMVDRRAMTGPGGVVLEDERQLDKFREWARIGRAQQAPAHFIGQQGLHQRCATLVRHMQCLDSSHAGEQRHREVACAADGAGAERALAQMPADAWLFDFHLDARNDFVGDGVVAVAEPFGAKFLEAL